MANARKSTPNKGLDIEDLKDRVEKKQKGENKVKKNIFTGQVLAWVQFVLISVSIVAGIGFYFGTQYANAQKQSVQAEATVLAKELVAKQPSKTE